MSIKSSTSSALSAPADPISPATDLTRYFNEGGKPASSWAVGPELELFGFTADRLARIDLDQIRGVFNGFGSEITSHELEAGVEVQLGAGRRALMPAPSMLTLEPGGQIEFSGAHHRSLYDVELELREYLVRLREIGEALDIVFVATGFDPIRSIGEQRWVPKRRYEIMRPYLASRGRRAWDMMCRTAAMQVNLDYSDPDDLSKKFTLANRLGPIAAAMFANSPFEEGRLSGYKSTRYAVWLETDPDRTGPSPLALGDDFSIERFLDYAARVPLLFIRRGGTYIDLTGRSFRDLIGNRLGHQPIFQDFRDHLSTIFTEARLRPHIEQRSMDCNSLQMMMAALAFWKGLMYSPQTLEEALRTAPKLDRASFGELQLEVARRGLEAEVGSIKVIRVAEAAIELARAGLASVAPDEAAYLDALEGRVIKERICPADILIRNFEGSWNGDIRKAMQYLERIENPKSKI